MGALSEAAAAELTKTLWPDFGSFAMLLMMSLRWPILETPMSMRSFSVRNGSVCMVMSSSSNFRRYSPDSDTFRPLLRICASRTMNQSFTVSACGTLRLSAAPPEWSSIVAVPSRVYVLFAVRSQDSESILLWARLSSQLFPSELLLL